MTKLSKILALFFLTLALGSARAGVKEDADSLYAAYNNARLGGANEEVVYTLLGDCCDKYVELVESKGINVNDYVTAKERMRLMYPNLQYAGVYFSQHNNAPIAVKILEKYINIPKMDVFKDELFSRSEYYPSLVYYVASNKFNQQDFKGAVFYLNEYLATNDRANECKAYVYLSRAYSYLADDENQVLTLMRALQKYPKDVNLLHDIVKFHIKMRNAAQAELYASAYEAQNPKPTDLYAIKAGIAELKGDYLTSLKISEQLYSHDPNNYEYVKMYARSCYNYVVMEMNSGKRTADGKPTADLKPYLENAAQLFVIAANHQPQKAYLDGLIDTYLLLDRKDEAMAVAKSIGRQLDDMKNNNRLLTEQSTANINSDKITKSGVPVFSVFVKDFIGNKLRVWMQKGAYEKTAEYEERTSGEMLKAKKQSLIQEAKAAYIRQFSGTMQVNGIVIGGYDADHEVYLIKYNLGNMLVHVPLADDQAQKFQDDWSRGLVRVAEPKFDVSGDSLILSGLTFVSPQGISYKYDISEKLKYEAVDVKINNPIAILNDNLLADADIKGKKSQQNIENTTIEIGDINKKSDIDIDIPQDSIPNKFTFALIISNENYQFADKVNYALSDGKSFENYCRKTLGIPKKNIRHINDASFLGMKGQLSTFTQICKEYADSAHVIVYYSGHGVPNYETQEAYLLPIDGSPVNDSGRIPLDGFYTSLAETGVRTITVFLDCCFSGASKSGNMLMAARGTAIKPKVNDPKGNMVVMTACSGDEVAFHYSDQRHGMFTYFLLKKLKESKGDVSLLELYEYVRNNVRRQSLHDKDKKQEPNILFSPSLSVLWQDIRLK